MKRAIVTFYNPEKDQKIIINFTENTINGTLDYKLKTEPVLKQDDNIELIGYLAQSFLESLIINNEVVSDEIVN